MDKNTFYEPFEIKKHNKVRKIIKYRNDENGLKVKKLHSQILGSIQEKYKSNTSSFAYQPGKSIKQCIDCHLQGKSFIKLDITKFFNSIQKNVLLSQCMTKLDIDFRYQPILEELLEMCFFNNELSLGLILSPILSDIYLAQFDENISQEVECKGFIYTRYADDILISAARKISAEEYKDIYQIVEGQLKTLGLRLNHEKSQLISFDERHCFIRYLGVNIIDKNETNVLSLGKTYINSVAKRYLKYLEKKQILENNKKEMSEEEILHEESYLFYERKKIIGQAAFVKQIEGEDGINRINKRLGKYNVKIDNL